MTSHSQLDPLPPNLPFELISDTLGRGAYAFVRKAREYAGATVFAVKFIHKGFAAQYGGITAKELSMESSTHQYIGHHDNVIDFYRSEETPVWKWIAMEFAEGGDLFDKIEADVGVQEDIAHFYFHQLMAGVGFMHGKGIAHRDIKPENMLLDKDGNLKIGDFGFAQLFRHPGKGTIKMSTRTVGSPPYVAPEVPAQTGYQGDQVDIWSCGVVLFVLLTGNTPWDEPTDRSGEFQDYKTNPRFAKYDPWNRLPAEALHLMRGMMCISRTKRFTMSQIEQHPWCKKPNPLLDETGMCDDGVGLATRLIEGLRVELNSSQVQVEATPEEEEDEDEVMVTQYPEDVDGENLFEAAVSATQQLSLRESQGIRDSQDGNYDVSMGSSQSQPSQYLRNRISQSQHYEDDSLYETVAEDPTMSQFTAAPAVPLSLTQIARRFQDICPSNLTRFYTDYNFSNFLPLLNRGLTKLKIPLKNERQIPAYYDHPNHTEWVKIRMRDTRKEILVGNIGIERIAGSERGNERGLLCVTFVRTKGDPVEWRRFFKKVSIFCQIAVYKPGGH